MGRTAPAALRDADQIVLAKCRAYVMRRYYLQVVVFTKWWTEIDLLVTKYQGRWYRHGAGYVWVLSKRDDIVHLMNSLETQLPSSTNFESVIVKTFDEQAIKNVTEG